MTPSSPRSPEISVHDAYETLLHEASCRVCGFYIGELGEKTIFSPCNHTYHPDCILRVYKTRLTHCPICPITKASPSLRQKAKCIAAFCCCLALVGAVVASAFVFGCQKDCFFH